MDRYQLAPEKALIITNDSEALKNLVYATGILCAIVNGLALRFNDQEAIEAANIANAMLSVLALYTESND